MITIYYFSNFWEVDRLPNTKASSTILKLKSHFTRYGIPDQVISDHGPQFTADEVAEFSKNGILRTLPVALEIAKPMVRPSLGWRQSSVFWRNQTWPEPTHASPYSTIETRSLKGWRPAQHNVWWAERPKHSFLPLRSHYFAGQWPGSWKERAATAPAGPSQALQPVRKGSTQSI